MSPARVRLKRSNRAARAGKGSSRREPVHHVLGLYHLMDAIVRAGSRKELYRCVLDSILKVLRCDRAALLLCNNAGLMQFEAWRGLSERYRKAVEGHSAWAPGEKDPQLKYIQDIAKSTLPESIRAAVKREGIGALAFLPLVFQGALRGKFMVYYDSPHVFAEEELQIAQAVANQAAFGIERKHAEEALREREERFRRLVSLLPAAVYTCDAEGRITFFNRRAAEIWGREPRPGELDEKFSGSFWQRGAAGSTLAGRKTPMTAAITKNKPVRNLQVTIEQPSGTRVVVNMNIDLLHDTKGVCLGAINVFEDITERQRAQELTNRLAAIVEYSDDAIISKDLRGTIVSWNRGAERLFGYTSQEAVGHPVTMLIPPDRLGEEPDILDRIHKGELIDHYETVRRRKDGTLLDVSLTVSPLRDQHGKVIGASKIARDITERKRAEKVLSEAQAELQRHASNLQNIVLERTADLRATNEQLEAFVYSIAHDLRAPLRSMEGYSAMLLEEIGASFGDPVRSYASHINRSARFMDQLLTDLLTFSQMSQQRLELAPVDLGAALQSVRSVLESEIEEKGAKLEFSGPWPSVMAHGATLRQVLYNLISNALKFVSSEVSPRVRVRVESGPRSAATKLATNQAKRSCPPGWVRIWVEDNGIGIAPEYQEQIFRLFTRLEGGKYSGTGIGLAIVQKGIERMNGRVGLESIPGQGSRFWVELRAA